MDFKRIIAGMSALAIASTMTMGVFAETTPATPTAQTVSKTRQAEAGTVNLYSAKKSTVQIESNKANSLAEGDKIVVSLEKTGTATPTVKIGANDSTVSSDGTTATLTLTDQQATTLRSGFTVNATGANVLNVSFEDASGKTSLYTPVDNVTISKNDLTGLTKDDSIEISVTTAQTSTASVSVYAGSTEIKSSATPTDDKVTIDLTDDEKRDAIISNGLTISVTGGTVGDVNRINTTYTPKTIYTNEGSETNPSFNSSYLQYALEDDYIVVTTTGNDTEGVKIKQGDEDLQGSATSKGNTLTLKATADNIDKIRAGITVTGTEANKIKSIVFKHKSFSATKYYYNNIKLPDMEDVSFSAGDKIIIKCTNMSASYKYVSIYNTERYKDFYNEYLKFTEDNGVKKCEVELNEKLATELNNNKGNIGIEIDDRSVAITNVSYKNNNEETTTKLYSL